MPDAAFWGEIGGLDPQKEYAGGAWELFRCCLLRTLYSYNGQPTERGGLELRPDLAESMPEVSPDGLTWTFRLRPGIRYGPPFERAVITSTDLVRALQREAMVPPNVGYAFYYSVILGFDEYAAGKSDSIAGLETPDGRTLVVQLKEPATDLAYRFSLAATAPIPPRAADGHDDYGRFLVPSGPYMIEGSEALDPTRPPGDQQPVSGFVPPTKRPGSLTLVRNPSWDPATDGLRAGLPDRIEVALGGNAQELAADVEKNKLDLVFGASATADQVKAIQADPVATDRVFQDPADSVMSITMNVAMPPFDDVYVRRAVSFAVDKAELLRALANAPYPFFSTGIEATHLAPDSEEANLLLGWDPYPYDLARAKAEMRRSAYDHDGDGTCDAPACGGILTLVNDVGTFARQARVIRRDLAAIGIDLRLQPLPQSRFWPRMNDPAQRITIGIGTGWAKDFPNASSWFPTLFEGDQIEAGTNVTHVGASPEQLRAWGYPVTSVPSVDDRIVRCLGRFGSDQTECWAELDQYLMDEVVPSVPYITFTYAQIVSERVVGYSFDQFATLPALDRIALAPGSD